MIFEDTELRKLSFLRSSELNIIYVFFNLLFIKCIQFQSATTVLEMYHSFCVFPSAENVPAELRDPFYCDQYEQEHLKPPVTRLLQGSELYCRAYSLLQGRSGTETQPKDYVALLQLLSQRGLIPKDQDTPVTEADLRHKPIKMVNKNHCLFKIIQVICSSPKRLMSYPMQPNVPAVQEFVEEQNGLCGLGC